MPSWRNKQYHVHDTLIDNKVLVSAEFLHRCSEGHEQHGVVKAVCPLTEMAVEDSLEGSETLMDNPLLAPFPF